MLLSLSLHGAHFGWELATAVISSRQETTGVFNWGKSFDLGTTGVFNWGKSFDLGIARFVVILQLISYHKLINIIRFISYELVKLCN